MTAAAPQLLSARPGQLSLTSSSVHSLVKHFGSVQIICGETQSPLPPRDSLSDRHSHVYLPSVSRVTATPAPPRQQQEKLSNISPTNGDVGWSVNPREVGCWWRVLSAGCVLPSPALAVIWPAGAAAWRLIFMTHICHTNHSNAPVRFRFISPARHSATLLHSHNT